MILVEGVMKRRGESPAAKRKSRYSATEILVQSGLLDVQQEKSRLTMPVQSATTHTYSCVPTKCVSAALGTTCLLRQVRPAYAGLGFQEGIIYNYVLSCHQECIFTAKP
jgi:hypothetical protein